MWWLPANFAFASSVSTFSVYSVRAQIGFSLNFDTDGSGQTATMKRYAPSSVPIRHTCMHATWNQELAHLNNAAVYSVF